MPGGRLRSFRLGDRTELMAEFALNTIAFTTRVPRQEDIGHDFVCALAELRNDFYWAGCVGPAILALEPAPERRSVQLFDRAQGSRS